MIRRLRRRMTLMVIAVLILISAGIVLAIHLSNIRSITSEAESSLAVLAENSGVRSTARPDGDPPAGRGETPPPKPDEDSDGSRTSREGKNQRGNRSQPPSVRSGSRTAASLSNSYSITLNEDGSVDSWTSDRTDLYSDLQVASMAESILAGGRKSGRIGTQYYRLTEKDGQRLIIVLDARMEYLSASNVLRSTILVAAAACVLLSMLAWLLVRRMVQPVEDAFARQKQFVSDASQNEYLGYIRSEVKRTDSLVSSLLTLARMDRNEQKAEMKRFDLSHALLDVTLPFESTVFEAGKSLEYDIPDSIDCIGNEEMIKQLAVILLSNALKYSDDGGRIRISLKARGRQREIRVFNTGQAIAPGDQEKIFDRFWRADPAHGRDTGGHGLGLAIARTIVETHRGRIAVESRENEGTAFIVTLSGT